MAWEKTSETWYRDRMAFATNNIGVIYFYQSEYEKALDLYYKTTVGDNENRITEVLNLALDRSNLIITSGGLEGDVRIWRGTALQ